MVRRSAQTLWICNNAMPAVVRVLYLVLVAKRLVLNTPNETIHKIPRPSFRFAFFSYISVITFVHFWCNFRRSVRGERRSSWGTTFPLKHQMQRQRAPFAPLSDRSVPWPWHRHFLQPGFTQSCKISIHHTTTIYFRICSNTYV